MAAPLMNPRRPTASSSSAMRVTLHPEVTWDSVSLFVVLLAIFLVRNQRVLPLRNLPLTRLFRRRGALLRRVDGEERQLLLQIVRAARGAGRRRVDRAHERLEFVPAFAALEVKKRHGLAPPDVTIRDDF